MALNIVTAILTLLAGIGVFLLSLRLLSVNLERLSGNKLKILFNKTSKSKLLGVGIGTVATAAIQSSGAVSVMIIGFVNAGLMSLTQAATMIFGANIGTTVTGQIVALGLLGGGGFKVEVAFAAFAGIGAIISLFAKKDKTINIAGLLTGFGMLFVGLDVMSRAMIGLSQLPSFSSFIISITNPILLVLIGTVLTAIIQSSSVMTGIAITMLSAGLITLDQGIYMTLGSNIGSCVVAIIAGMASSTNAKRTALIHFLFNVIGVVFFLIIDVIMRAATPDGVTFGSLLESAFAGVPGTQLAMLHTFFNVATVILILPFTNLVVKLVIKMIPERKRKGKIRSDEPHLFFIEEHMLTSPPVAVQQVKNELVNMAEIAMRNFNLSLDVICSLDFSKKKAFERDEAELNYLNREIVRFIVKLSKEDLSERDHIFLSTALHSVTDLERIGDYAENIMEYAVKLDENHTGFSDDAVQEIKNLKELVESLYQKVMKAYVNTDLMSLKEAFELEDEVDKLTEELSNHHIERLDAGVCTPDVGAQYLSLTANTERVADHFINVAKTILMYVKPTKEQRALQRELQKPLKKAAAPKKQSDKLPPILQLVEEATKRNELANEVRTSEYMFNGTLSQDLSAESDENTAKTDSLETKVSKPSKKRKLINSLAIATNNKNKLAEIREILGDKFPELLSLDDLGIKIDIEETGETFADNALIKARTITSLTGIPALADDSGLVVDALDGAPGVYSARYAGEEHDDKKNNALLLKNLKGKPREAHFCSVVALTYPDGSYVTAEGQSDGRITAKECGENGFGYDPLFYCDELKKTFAEASAEEKNTVSHRARALTALVEKLNAKK